ncbi:Hsp20/alpha crystallin family protein [Geomonas sp. RF6]|uniref:Hsp20/alpha crystallin family protein n=1 Tax=Geomonas sp. RF6 TaxID=2897342 RepID=UPI001E3F17BA|nr:Hsp20/alpha crystallin family protein [Geomonas sp. RF6]UFS72523.1 Hsp20/alpha crystallin family protein [Geomonas sp. RF6]
MASWDIFRELDSLRREMDEAFRGVGFNRPMAASFLSPQAARRFPLVNLSEDEGHVYLEALLPGVDPKQTELSVLRNSVSISGERKPFAEQRGQIVHRSELGSGKFTRTLEIPVDINPDNISAQYNDGILRITMPKAEHVRPKKIDISVS